MVGPAHAHFHAYPERVQSHPGSSFEVLPARRNQLQLDQVEIA